MKKGFTLAELLAAIIIIAVLAAVALPQFTRMVERGRATEAVLNVSKLQDSLIRMNKARGSGNSVTLLSQLDISIPGTVNDDGSISTQYFKYTIDGQTIIATRNDNNLAYSFVARTVAADNSILIECGYASAGTAPQAVKQLCADMGYTEAGTVSASGSSVWFQKKK